MTNTSRIKSNDVKFVSDNRLQQRATVKDESDARPSRSAWVEENRAPVLLALWVNLCWIPDESDCGGPDRMIMMVEGNLQPGALITGIAAYPVKFLGRL